MLEIKPIKDGFTVCADGKKIGNIKTYRNPFHNKNIYIEPSSGLINYEIAEELFKKLRSVKGAPLQIGVYSDNVKLTEFLMRGGFKKMRTCSLMVVSAADMKEHPAPIEISCYSRDDRAFKECAEKYYNYYSDTHRNINPLSVDFNEFEKILPNCLWASKDLRDFAFTEENEIAYVYGESEKYRNFLGALIKIIFSKYPQTEFECDDCDPAANVLKELFNEPKEPTFDTYIFS